MCLLLSPFSPRYHMKITAEERIAVHSLYNILLRKQTANRTRQKWAFECHDIVPSSDSCCVSLFRLVIYLLSLSSPSSPYSLYFRFHCATQHGTECVLCTRISYLCASLIPSHFIKTGKVFKQCCRNCCCKKALRDNEIHGDIMREV